MAYMEDFARSWPPRRKARAIERSVDRAVMDAAAHRRDSMADRRAQIGQAEAAVDALPASHFAALGAKFGIPAKVAKARLLRAAQTNPEVTIKACAHTQASLAKDAA